MNGASPKNLPVPSDASWKTADALTKKCRLMPLQYLETIALALDAFAAERERATWEAAAMIADEWLAAYPADIFIEPPAGQHGQTVDACSARAARHVAAGIGRQIRARVTEVAP